MGQPPQPGFLPSCDGFDFDNAWPPSPGISIRTPAGSIGIGNAAAGLCGGMVFAALDYWHARRPPPPERPAAGTTLYRYIVRRLVDSWRVPAGVLRYYWWMLLPDGDRRVRGLSWRTIKHQWPLVRASIDRGTPAALGVVTMASAWPGRLGHNHQVLAYGYEVSGRVVTLKVYDPNSGPADDIRISFDSSAPATATAFEHNLGIGWPVRGFFLTRYSPAAPP